MKSNSRLPALAATLMAALLLTPAVAVADDPNILAPYRYQPAPQQLTPLEQQKAFIYRSQVQNQLRSLQSDDSKGQLDSFDQRLLLNTRGELQRMNSVLGY